MNRGYAPEEQDREVWIMELEELAEPADAWVEWGPPEEDCLLQAAAPDWVDAYEV